MIEINFIVDQNILLREVLRQKDKLTVKSGLLYDLCEKIKFYEKIRSINKRTFNKKLMRTNEFQKLLKQTMMYKENLIFEYALLKENIEKLLKEILRVELKGVFTCYVIDKDFGICKNEIGTENIIYGVNSYYSHLQIILLLNNVICNVMEKIYGKSDIVKSIMEIAIMNELRIRLNKKGTYFEINGEEFIYNKELTNEIYPFWLKYMENDNKNIFLFINSINSLVV
jgi:hypothetical protein